MRGEKGWATNRLEDVAIMLPNDLHVLNVLVIPLREALFAVARFSAAGQEPSFCHVAGAFENYALPRPTDLE